MTGAVLKKKRKTDEPKETIVRSKKKEQVKIGMILLADYLVKKWGFSESFAKKIVRNKFVKKLIKKSI